MCFYLLSDGYIDQLGGEHELPFGKKRLKKALLAIYQNKFDYQKQKLIEILGEYHGSYQVIDDVTMVGFRLDSML